MKSKLRKRGGLLVLAAAILSLAFIAAITAYLTDKDNFATSFHTASTNDIDISISGEDVEGLVTHGEEVDLTPTIANNGSIPVYVFAEVTADDGLTPDMSDGWTEYTPGIYYYGDESGLSEFDVNSTTTVFDSVVVDAEPGLNVETEQDELNISVDAYALQTGGFDPSDISTAWDMASATTTP